MLRKLRIISSALLIVLLFAIQPGYAQTAPVRVPRNHFVAKFRNIQIKDFLKTMAEITRQNILIPDNIKGKITIVSYRPIPVSRAYEFLQQVLEVKGYAVIRERHLLKVIRVRTATTSTQPQDFDPDKYDSGVVTRVIPIPSGGKAQQLVGVLRPLLGKNTNITAYRDTNSLIITGHAKNVRRGLQILKRLGIQPETPDSPGGTKEDTAGVHIYRVKNMKADSLAQVLVRLENPQLQLRSGTKKKAVKGKRTVVRRTVRRPGRNAKIKAVAHKESNSLIVTAGPEEWREIRGIIKRLDRVRNQILLEVLIVEVNSNRLNDFGIDWRYQGKQGPHTQFNSGRVLEGGLINDKGTITGNNTLSGFSLGFLEKGGELLGIFNANVTNSNFNVLSAPQILTLDNQEAEINVGQDVPVRTQEKTSSEGGATTNSFDYRPAGIKLKFTPHVNPEGLIGIDLFQEVTNIEGGATAGTNPTFNKRSIKTYVTVRNKQTIVVGGLVSSQKNHSVSKIPLLGDIPLLGFLFRRTTYDTKKTNLMVFITPHVLDDPMQARRISTYKRAEQIRRMRKTSNELKLWPEKSADTHREQLLKRMQKKR